MLATRTNECVCCQSPKNDENVCKKFRSPLYEFDSFCAVINLEATILRQTLSNKQTNHTQKKMM